jgi:hypothetical protein
MTSPPDANGAIGGRSTLRRLLAKAATGVYLAHDTRLDAEVRWRSSSAAPTRYTRQIGEAPTQ